ncbi:MAG: hypothetical protein WCL32_21480, partial [Planctomycetota bacterium]
LSLEISGIALGLFVSACAGRSKNAANLMLPLVMIAQMVFSASAAGASGPLPNVYRDFHAKSRPAASLSYLLASRYGDVLVQSRLNPYRVTESVRVEEEFTSWAHDAFGGLATIIALLVGMTFAILKLQSSGFLRHRGGRAFTVLNQKSQDLNEHSATAAPGANGETI